MATSGSTNYKDNRDQLIKDSLVEVGAIASEDTPSSDINEFAARKLNRMIKSWQTDGMQLWKLMNITVLLEKNKNSYDIGLTGDHVALTSDITETAIRVAGVALDTTIECDATTGMTASDYVGIVLDDGTIHFTTVSVVTDADTFTIATAIPSATAINKQIYFYTNKAERPLMITPNDGYIRDTDGGERTITIISREEWNSRGDKTASSNVVEAYYDPKLTNGVLKVFNQPDDVTDALHLVAQYPLEDMDAALDDFDFPQEWLLALQLQLSLQLTLNFPIPKEEFIKIKTLADEAYDKALAWDAEKVSVFLQPERNRGNR